MASHSKRCCDYAGVMGRALGSRWPRQWRIVLRRKGRPARLAFGPHCHATRSQERRSRFTNDNSARTPKKERLELNAEPLVRKALSHKAAIDEVARVHADHGEVLRASEHEFLHQGEHTI